MKYLVASDIHGDKLCAKEIVDAAMHHQVDHVLLLGDLLYHGPRNDLPEYYAPKETIELLNSIWDKVIAVRGNCDAEVDQMVLKFPINADYQILPFGQRRIFMSHGHIYGPENLPALAPNDIFLFGHIHVPVLEIRDDFYIFNPGSVSLPKENHPRTYGILDESGFKIYTLEHAEYRFLNF